MMCHTSAYFNLLLFDKMLIYIFMLPDSVVLETEDLAHWTESQINSSCFIL